MKAITRHLPAVVVLVVGVALSYGAYRWADTAEREAQARAFAALSESTFREVDLLIRRPVYGLLGLRGSLALTGERAPTAAQLEAYVGARDLATEFPNVLGMGVIVPIDAGDESALVAGVRAAGDPEFAIHGTSTAPTRFIITGIAPRDANRPAVGFDIGSEPTRRAAAERALREGAPILTGPIQLLQDEERRPGALLMLPAFASGKAQRTAPDDHVTALLYVAMVYDAPYKRSRNADGAGIRIRMVDGDTPLFDSDPTAVASPVLPPATHTVEAFGRTMTVEVQATPAFVAKGILGDTRMVFLAGLALTGLTLLLVLQQQRLQRRAESLAAGMTQDLDPLAAVARLTRSAVVITDAEGLITWVNESFRQLSGYEDHELMGKKPGDLLQTPETDPEEIARIRECLASREAFSGVLLNRSKAGNDFFIEIEIQPMFDGRGELTGFISIQTDISERLEQRAKLKASEALLDRTGDLSRVGGWRVEIATGRVMWSRITREIHEVDADYTPSVERGIEFYAPEARPVITAAVEKSIADGKGWDLELPLITAKGRRIWVRAVGKPEYEDGRLVALNGAFADITSAVETRREVELERERLAMILTGTGAGTWEWNVQTGETRFNARWAQIVGHTLDELAPISIQTWMSLTHPDDLKASGALLEAHFRGESRAYICEARMRHKSGHWVWVLDRGRVMTWTPDGKPEWMFGTHVDITERKESELRLRENEALLSTTLHSIGDAVLTTDADGRITWINPVAEHLTGWSADEARGRMAADVLRLEIDGQPGWAPCPIATCLTEGKKVGLAGNTILVAKNGERHVIEDSASPLKQHDGRVLGAVMVFHDVTEKAELAKEMSFRATHDALTGLVNRQEFERQLEQALGRAKGGARSGVVMFLDLDHFKMVNDSCGHAAGDRLLVQISALFRNEVRGRDVVARFGGDEFAIFLEDCPVEQGRRIGQTIVDAVDRYRFVNEDGRRFRVGVSVGLVPLDAHWLNLPQLMQAADAACYAAKSEGRNRIVVGEDAVSLAGVAREIQWGPMIEQALDEDLFELYAQRVFPLQVEANPKLRCEVLLRLKSNDGKIHGPGTFIPAAERYQLASRIDRWVVRKLLEALKDRPMSSVARVAFNLSGQSVGDRDFHRFALDAIETSGLPAEKLCIEITETAAIRHLGDAGLFVAALRDMGVQVALDDFGAGSSSFGYLKSLKVDVLKIDGQFVRGLLQGELEAAAVRSFVDVARVLDLRTVAEQVETEAIASRLVQLGIDFGQGYFYHRPEPLHDLLAAWSSTASNVVAPVFNAIRKRPS